MGEEKKEKTKFNVCPVCKEGEMMSFPMNLGLLMCKNPKCGHKMMMGIKGKSTQFDTMEQ